MNSQLVFSLQALAAILSVAICDKYITLMMIENMPTGDSVSDDNSSLITNGPSNLWKRILNKWWIVLLIGLFVLYLDLYQDFNRDKQSTETVVNTGFVIALFLISFGFLLGIYWQRLASEKTALKTLTIQHDFSVKLASAQGWDDILTAVSNFITTFVSISTGFLYIRNPKTDSYQRVSAWDSSGLSPVRERPEKDPVLCEACQLDQNPDNRIKLCNVSEEGNAENHLNSFCLPLQIKEQQIGILRITLLQNELPDSRQVELLKTLVPNLAIVVQAAIQRQTVLNISVETATENERRTLTHDLHDTLGQNLSYLRLKLDQMIRSGRQGQSDKQRKDLDHMLMVAAESCELVQETLIILDPDESPPLSKILKEYCEIVGIRSNLEQEFDVIGKPTYLTQQTSRQVFYLFREALSNIEKHANASRVAVSVLWTDTELEIRIADNGSGFDIDTVPAEGHYGLKSMRQRVKNLNGEFSITSSPGSGTQLLIVLPFISRSAEYIS